MQRYVVAPVGVHVSSVHTSESAQFGAAPALHTPDWHESLTVQPFESALHAVPSVLFVQAVWLVEPQHCWQTFDGFASPFV
jgi:hypothetical protein